MRVNRTLFAVVGTYLVTNAFNFSVAAGWFANTPDLVLWALWLLGIAVWVLWGIAHPIHYQFASWARSKTMIIGLGAYIGLGASVGGLLGASLYVLNVASKRNTPQSTAGAPPPAAGIANQSPSPAAVAGAPTTSKPDGSKPREPQQAKAGVQQRSGTPDVVPLNPELQLLDRALEAVRSCHSFLEASHKRRQEAYAKIQQHDAMPGITEESKKTFTNWINDGVNKDDMKLYDQVYKQGFMEVRRLLGLKMPDAVNARVDYENPGNMSGILGICHELSDMTERYIALEATQGRITPDQASRYLEALRRAQALPRPPRTER